MVFGIYEGGAPTNVVLEVQKPNGSTDSYGTIGTGIFSVEEKDLSRSFASPGLYTIKLSSSSIGRLRFNLYGAYWVGIRL